MEVLRNLRNILINTEIVINPEIILYLNKWISNFQKNVIYQNFGKILSFSYFNERQKTG